MRQIEARGVRRRIGRSPPGDGGGAPSASSDQPWAGRRAPRACRAAARVYAPARHPHDSEPAGHERLRPALPPLGAAGFRPAPARAPDRAMQRQIDDGKAPGLSMLIARHGKVAYRQSLGDTPPRRAVDARRRDLPHLFDDEAGRLGRGDDPDRGGAALRAGSRLGLHPRLRRREGRRPQRRQARPPAARAARSRCRT